MKIISKNLSLAITIFLAGNFVDILAQTNIPLPKPQGCVAQVSRLYFTDPAVSNVAPVTAIHPETGKGYLLHIFGRGTANFTPFKESYMSSLSFVGKSDDSATWQIVFEPNKAQSIGGLKMASKCNREPDFYPLSPEVRLFGQ